MSLINTDYKRLYEYKPYCVASLGDGIFGFVNHGFNKYRIIFVDRIENFTKEEANVLQQAFETGQIRDVYSTNEFIDSLRSNRSGNEGHIADGERESSVNGTVDLMDGGQSSDNGRNTVSSNESEKIRPTKPVDKDNSDILFSKSIKSSDPFYSNAENEESANARFSIVTDQKTIDWFDSQEKVTVYRVMTYDEATKYLGGPMSSEGLNNPGKGKVVVEKPTFGQLEQSEEHLDNAIWGEGDKWAHIHIKDDADGNTPVA